MNKFETLTKAISRVTGACAVWDNHPFVVLGCNCCMYPSVVRMASLKFKKKKSETEIDRLKERRKWLHSTREIPPRHHMKPCSGTQILALAMGWPLGCTRRLRTVWAIGPQDLRLTAPTPNKLQRGVWQWEPERKTPIFECHRCQMIPKPMLTTR